MSTIDPAFSTPLHTNRFSGSAPGQTAKATGDGFRAAPPALDVIPRPAGGPALSGHAAAVARIQSHVQDDLALQKTPDADGLILRPNTQSIFMPQPDGVQAKGTVVMWHGFTAGPWQYKEMAQRFYDSGYNVYVPRMLGHGYANAETGMPTGQNIPDANHRGEWEQSVDTAYTEAKALGAPVYGVGLSGGADLALYMAEKHDVKGTAAMSPYLGGDGLEGLIFPAIDDADSFTDGEVGKLLDHIPFQKNKIVPNDLIPHTEGNLGQATVMQEVGHNITHISSPVQLLNTSGDALSGLHKVDDLTRKLGGPGQVGWYIFPKNEGVPHAMLSPVENKAPGAAQTVSDVVFNFIDKQEFTNRN